MHRIKDIIIRYVFKRKTDGITNTVDVDIRDFEKPSGHRVSTYFNPYWELVSREVLDGGKQYLQQKYKEAVEYTFAQFIESCYDESGSLTEEGFAKLKGIMEKPVYKNEYVYVQQSEGGGYYINHETGKRLEADEVAK